MSLALRRVAPSLLTRLQVPIQVALYAALFLIADRLVQQFHLPLPANIVGMLMLLALILLRILPLSWVKAGSRWLLAEMLLVLRAGGGGGGQLRPTADGRGLEDLSGDRGQHHADAGRHRAGGGQGVSAGDLAAAAEAAP